MVNHSQNQINGQRARTLRENQTRSEGLLWSVLRAKQLCGLKFRRQHPIGPWITDVAAITKELNVPYEFKRRKANGSGMKCANAVKKSETK